MAINEDVRFWDPEGDSIKGVVVIKNTNSQSLVNNLDLVEYYASVLNSDSIPQYYLAGIYKDDILRFEENPELALLLLKISIIFKEEPIVEEEEFQLEIDIEPLPEKQFKSLSRKKNFWKVFYKRYPNTHGYYSFSKIVYEGNFAAFYVAHMWYSLAGSGDVIYLQKTNDGWKIIATQNLWRS